MRQTRSATGPLPEINYEAALRSSRRPSVLENERRRNRVREHRRLWRSNGKAFPFFSLPPEVRLMVFRELFYVKTIFPIRPVTFLPKSRSKPVISLALGLLFSCRQAYEEGRCVLYSENKFCLFPRDIRVSGFLGNIGHANRMAMATTVRLLDMDVEHNYWSSFCALASEMPIRALEIKIYTHTPLEPSIGATWVKDLARIISLKNVLLSFIPVPYNSYYPYQPTQGFLNYFRKELERDRGEMLYQGRVELGPVSRLIGDRSHFW